LVLHLKSLCIILNKDWYFLTRKQCLANKSMNKKVPLICIKVVGDCIVYSAWLGKPTR
jgi:hypothetical protein